MGVVVGAHEDARYPVFPLAGAVQVFDEAQTEAPSAPAVEAIRSGDGARGVR
jgi:hypothetical protein